MQMRYINANRIRETDNKVDTVIVIDELHVTDIGTDMTKNIIS